MLTGRQWEVDQHIFRTRPPEDNYDFATRRIGEIEDWGNCPIYTFPVHLAEKEWVDIEDFIEVFVLAWSVYGPLQPQPLDQTILDRSLFHARKVARQRF
jgi:hypothetical protein